MSSPLLVLALATAVSTMPAAAQGLREWSDGRSNATGECRAGFRPSAPAPGYVRQSTAMQTDPSPQASQGALLEVREPVTILGSCQHWIKIRDGEGQEGWVSAAVIARGPPPADPMIRQQEQAALRSAARAADLDAARQGNCASIRSPSLRLECENRQVRDLRAAPLPGGYLSSEDVRQTITGKTLTARPRNRPGENLRPHIFFFDRETGEVFYRSGEGGMASRWRGPWTLQTDSVCIPGGGLPCWRVHHATSGPYALHLSTGQVWQVEIQDGDPTATKLEVSKYYPQSPMAGRPAAPAAGGGSLPAGSSQAGGRPSSTPAAGQLPAGPFAPSMGR